MKKTGLNGYVYDFSVDYDAIAVGDTLDIYKHLMKKHGIVWLKHSNLLKNLFLQKSRFLVAVH